MQDECQYLFVGCERCCVSSNIVIAVKSFAYVLELKSKTFEMSVFALSWII